MAKTILNELRQTVESVFHLDNNTVSTREAPVLADQVVDALRNNPIVRNATNQEPWYKSRIYRGLITTALGFVATQFGYNFEAGDLDTWLTVIGLVAQAWGLIYAWWGRFVGSKTPAPGEGK